MLFVNWSDLVKTSRKLVVSLKVRRKMSPGGVIHLIGDIMCENVRPVPPPTAEEAVRCVQTVVM